MPLQMENRTFSRVSIVDDDNEARDSYEYPIEELGLTVVPDAGPLRNLQRYVEALPAQADAVLCDFHLRKKGN